MKKIFTLFAAVVCGLAMNAKTLYLQPNDDWKKDGARFAIYAFGNGDAWYDMTSASEGYYQATVDDKYPTVIFCRMNGSVSDNDWLNKWNQTQDMTIESDKNLCVINGWDNAGSWSVYNGGGETPSEEGLEESGEDHDFALMGSIGGDWNIQEQLPEYMFDARGRWSGVLASHPDKQNISYVVIIDEEGNQYKTKGWAGENATSVTLYWANGFADSNVWQLPAGETIYLIMRKCTFKGSIELERVDQATYDAYSIDWGSENQAIENTTVGKKAHKQIIDGQLRIIRGDKMYDATGKAL